MPVNRSTDDIPVIDIDDEGNAETIRRVAEACHDIGFMIVQGRGVSADTIAGIRDAVVSFFDQPAELKGLHRVTSDNYRGYIPQGFFSPNAGGSDAQRYSFPYFAVPRFDTVVEPLIRPQTCFERSSVHVGDVSREAWRTNWPNAVPGRQALISAH